jgi:FRG domain
MTASWASRADENVEPSTWDKCVTTLLSLGSDDILYRGHASFDWQLNSTLERALLDHARVFDQHKYELMLSMAADDATENWANDVEKTLMMRFRQQALSYNVPDLPPLRDRLGWWEVMQHHGAPTRLLDWTTSPFIGLWFATESHQPEHGDMALWIYSRDTVSRNLATVIADIKSDEDYDLLDERELQNKLIQTVIAGDRTALLVPVKPRQFQRAIAQQSVLTVSPNIGVARPADWWVREKLATRIRIKQEWKPQIQAACQSMGLSRVSLYRDLDNLGASIRQNFLNKEFRPDLGLF